MTPRALLLIAACLCTTGPALAQTRETRAMIETVSYVFASELGSGVYDLGGRTLQVYRIPASWNYRRVEEASPGVRFILPVTFGFLDFDPLDLPEEGLPSTIDSFSVTPGIELDFLLRQDWKLTSWLRGGFSLASGKLDGWLYAAGVAAHRELPWRGQRLFQRHELAFAGAHFGNELPDDQYARLRQAVELRHGLGRDFRGRELEVGAYGILDLLPDPPSVPGSSGDGEPLRLEIGLMLGTRPTLKWRWIPLPRLGLGYRFAGGFSGWHFAIGSPF